MSKLNRTIITILVYPLVYEVQQDQEHECLVCGVHCNELITQNDLWILLLGYFGYVWVTILHYGWAFGKMDC